MNTFFALVLVFSNAQSGKAVPSAHVLVFETEAKCQASMSQYVNYEQGREAGLQTGDKVMGWCVPVTAMNTSGT